MRLRPSPEIGARLAQARNEAGLTQAELADTLDVNERTIQLYEAGRRIPYRFLQAIEEITGRSSRWILYGEQERAATLDRELMDLLATRHEDLVKRLEELGSDVSELLRRVPA